jgi:hypothetical protein
MTMKIVLALAFVLISLIACNKYGEDHPCYDETLVHQNACTTDCEGFEGCDGIIYCNECEAAKQGISAK